MCTSPGPCSPVTIAPRFKTKLHDATLRVVTTRTAGAPLCTAQPPREEHDALCEHSRRRDGPMLAVEGSVTGEIFETSLERVLAPEVRPGRIVAKDDLSAHRGERVRDPIEARGCELLFLPPYSPDLNPIEEAFAKVKAMLRRAGARTREALVDALRHALEAVTVRDARGFFEHCGYRVLGQPLCDSRRRFSPNILRGYEASNLVSRALVATVRCSSSRS